MVQKKGEALYAVRRHKGPSGLSRFFLPDCGRLEAALEEYQN
jgi:hypothetical protein